MDKQKALEELKVLQEKAKALEAIINAPEMPKTFFGIPVVPTGHTGYYFDFAGKIFGSGTLIEEDTMQAGDLMETREQARKLYAHRRLKFQAYQAMAKSWGTSSVPWADINVKKHVIASSCTSARWRTDFVYETWHEFAFKTEKDLKDFISSKSKEEILFLLRGMQYEGPSMW
jgi:hypothetical protein